MVRKSQSIITFGEYIQQDSQGIQILYKRFKLHLKDVTELILVATDISGADTVSVSYARKAQTAVEDLPWEKEEELW